MQRTILADVKNNYIWGKKEKKEKEEEKTLNMKATETTGRSRG